MAAQGNARPGLFQNSIGMEANVQEALHAWQVIAEKLLEYLRSATDDGQKAEVAQRIGELAERFAPDTQWFIDTMNQVSPLV